MHVWVVLYQLLTALPPFLYGSCTVCYMEWRCALSCAVYHKQYSLGLVMFQWLYHWHHWYLLDSHDSATRGCPRARGQSYDCQVSNHTKANKVHISWDVLYTTKPYWYALSNTIDDWMLHWQQGPLLLTLRNPLWPSDAIWRRQHVV